MSSCTSRAQGEWSLQASLAERGCPPGAGVSFRAGASLPLREEKAESADVCVPTVPSYCWGLQPRLHGALGSVQSLGRAGEGLTQNRP